MQKLISTRKMVKRRGMWLLTFPAVRLYPVLMCLGMGHRIAAMLARGL